MVDEVLDWDYLTRLLPNYDPYKGADDFYFDEEEANRVIFFFQNCLVHIKGELAGQLLVLEDWQKSYIGNLFGWMAKDGTGRRYRESLLYVPRKNGKSFISSGICIYMFLFDEEIGAEVVCAAFEKDQAKFVWDVAAKQINKHPSLKKLVKTYQASIIQPETDSLFKPISADARSSHGGNLHCAIMDELHVQRSADLVAGLETSQGSRRNPLFIMMTTSDFDRPSVCNQKHDYAKKVISGIIEDHRFLPCIYEASKDDDWRDPKIWRKANPNFGISIYEEYLARQCQKAIDDKVNENEFKRLHLNIKTEQSVRYIQMKDWDQCNGDVDFEALKGRECYGGLDLASIDDFAGLVLVFPNEDGSLDVLVRLWAPEDTAEKRQRTQGVPYVTWGEEGLIKLTPGEVIDYDYIEAEIVKLSEVFNIIGIGYDIYNAQQLQESLNNKHGINMVQFRQGWLSMNEPMKAMMRFLKKSMIRHGGHKVLRWMASNTAAKIDEAGNVKPDKKKSADKIDGIVALIMAIGMALFNDDNHKSIYEERGLLEF